MQTHTHTYSQTDGQIDIMPLNDLKKLANEGICHCNNTHDKDRPHNRFMTGEPAYEFKGYKAQT
jgi:hypothetical protein